MRSYIRYLITCLQGIPFGHLAYPIWTPIPTPFGNPYLPIRAPLHIPFGHPEDGLTGTINNVELQKL